MIMPSTRTQASKESVSSQVETMAEESDVVVIGGGAVGVCTAYYLARKGCRVTLIEKGEICSGCSYGNACMIVPSHAMPVPAPGVIGKSLKWMLKEDSPLLIRPRLDWRLLSWLLQFAAFCRRGPMERAIPVLRDLGRASLLLFRELAASEDLDFDFEQRGLMSVFSTDAGLEEGREEAEIMARHDLELEVLTGDQARELEPALNRRVVGALYSAEDAHGNSHRFVTGLGEALPKHGVKVRTGTEVTGWLLEGGRPAGVRTDRGDFRAREIVLATGSWTPLLAGELGVRVPVQAGKGYSLTMDRPVASPKIPLIHAERKVAVTPIGDRLRFAGTMEFAGIDLSLNPTRTEAIRRGALEVMSGSDSPANVERWCGLRPCTPDGLPIIDRLPRHPNLYLSTGHAMLGYTHGPISGKLMAEMVCGEPLSLPLEPLRLGRFWSRWRVKSGE